MRNITLNEFAKLLDECAIKYERQDDALLAPKYADEGVAIAFRYEGSGNDSRIHAYAWSLTNPKPRSRKKGLEFCNAWNAENAFPRAYIDQKGALRLDSVLYSDVDVEPAYVTQNFIIMFITCSRNFFKNVA